MAFVPNEYEMNGWKTTITLQEKNKLECEQCTSECNNINLRRTYTSFGLHRIQIVLPHLVYSKATKGKGGHDKWNEYRTQ